MENHTTLDSKLSTIAWGLLFIWWGLRWSLLVNLPEGSGLLGTAFILLGVNAARALNSTPSHGFTTVLAILTLTWGGLELVNSTALLPFQLPVFEILLIVLGVILLAGAIKSPSSGDPSQVINTY